MAKGTVTERQTEAEYQRGRQNKSIREVDRGRVAE